MLIKRCIESVLPPWLISSLIFHCIDSMISSLQIGSFKSQASLWSCAGPFLSDMGLNPGNRFSHKEAYTYMCISLIRVKRKPAFCICESKDTDQLFGNRTADQRLFFATQIVQSLYFLNTKYQASSHRLLPHSPFCVGPGWKPRRQFFSQEGSACFLSYSAKWDANQCHSRRFGRPVFSNSFPHRPWGGYQCTRHLWPNTPPLRRHAWQ